MENLIILFLIYGLFAIYLAIGMIVTLLLQAIVYWTTGFSIYNWLNKKLFKEVK